MMSSVHEKDQFNVDIPIPFRIAMERCIKHRNCLVTWTKGAYELGCPLCRATGIIDEIDRKEQESNG